jgi:hypothetical protein
MQNVPVYEDVTDPILLAGIIATKDNIAYGYTQQL